MVALNLIPNIEYSPIPYQHTVYSNGFRGSLAPSLASFQALENLVCDRRLLNQTG